MKFGRENEKIVARMKVPEDPLAANIEDPKQAFINFIQPKQSKFQSW